jgi:hypothetical protein
VDKERLRLKCDQALDILDPNYTQGPAFGTLRDFNPERTVFAHLQPLPGTQVEQLKAMASQVSILAWFVDDPNLGAGRRLYWRTKDVVLEVVNPPSDQHTRGLFWEATLSVSRKDNLGRGIVEMS